MTASDTGWLSGKRWTIKEANSSRVQQIVQHYGLNETIARMLEQRDIATEEVEQYLSPRLKELMPDPQHLKGMQEAVKRIAQAISKREKIGIFGDYDVDGATSSALLVRYFRDLGCETAVHIPDRQKEGYGPNIYGMQRLKDRGANLIITVDTGTLAHTALAEAKAIGLEVIVVDHHQGEPELPPALAIINPNRFDEESPLKQLAAVGVTFMLLVAINAHLKSTNRTDLPNLLSLLDIVALGTVCDVVPLTGLNRAFVRQGLQILRKSTNAGLRALMEIAGIDAPPTPYHLGFLLGPRINAGGRVGESELGTHLLSTTDFPTAQDIAKKLDQYNLERKAIEAQVQEEAMQQAQNQESAILIAQGVGWHEGIIGIVAGRIKEKYNQPSAVISWNHEGVGKASARSVKGIDLGQAVIAARQAGLLEAGGGHSMAAGFTIRKEKFAAFQDFMESRIQKDWQAYQENFSRDIDATIPISAATVELANLLEQVGPFGSGNPAPKFLLENVVVVKADVVGSNHLRCIVKDGEFGGRHNKANVKVMGFGLMDSVLGQTLINGVGRKFHLVGKLRSEYWRGTQSVTFFLEDAQPVTVSTLNKEVA